MINGNEIFTKVTLPSGMEACVIEGKGCHYFRAMEKGKGNTGAIIKYLILELVFIKDKLITKEEADNLPMRDVSYLFEVVALMMSND